MLSRVVISIGGMNCAACALNAQKAIEALDGVTKADVSILNCQAAVEFTGISVSEIEKVIEKAGFKVLSYAYATDAFFNARRTELKARKTRTLIACVFAAPLFYAAMAPMLNIAALPFTHSLIGLMNDNALYYALLQLALTLPVIAAGFGFFISGIPAFVHRRPNMDSLIALGGAAAFVYSLYAVWRIAAGNVHFVHSLYFETTGVVFALVLIGKTLETSSKEKTGAAVKKLTELAPKTAVIEKNGVQTEIPLDDVKPGDTVIIKPGGRIPADGVVISGNAAVDESMLTGESLPVNKHSGDNVYAATISLSGALRINAVKTGADTTLSQIIRLVANAQLTKPPIAALADKAAAVFVPVVCLIAFISGLAWFLTTRDFTFALNIFISVLIISCPCALGLATPVAVTAAVGAAARRGILVKNGEALQTAGQTDTVVLDKTGTVTTGKLSVSDVIPVNGDISRSTVLQTAASAERFSEHPMAKAITALAEEQGLAAVPLTGFKNEEGLGVLAVSPENNVYYIGNPAFMEKNGIDGLDTHKGTYASLAQNGKTVVYVAVNDTVIGIIAASDTLREQSAEAVTKLNKLGAEVHLLTGDNLKTAKHIANAAGIKKITAEVMPADKAAVIKKLQSENKKVAMAGDGINDAPALAQADVSFAMSSGTDIAIQSADIVLMRSNPVDIPAAISLSRRAVRIIKQNLFWAFCYNAIGIPVAAGVLHIFGGPLLNPMLAAAAMGLSSVSVVTNALRLYKGA